MYEGVQNPAAYKALSWVGQQGPCHEASAQRFLRSAAFGQALTVVCSSHAVALHCFGVSRCSL